MQKILITGANGFVARNLIVRLNELNSVEIIKFTHEMNKELLPNLVKQADFIFHLAGVNRPVSADEFKLGNADLSAYLCECIISSGRKIPLVFSSSTQAALSGDYAASKLSAEQSFLKLNLNYNNPVAIYRLPNLFGKWCRPNYNSVVSTFCYNIANDLEIHIDDADKKLTLAYIDDVVSEFIGLLSGFEVDVYCSISPLYEITLGELAAELYKFKNSHSSPDIEPVGSGLLRALYSTYISYYSPSQFSYPVARHSDPRGIFVEVLKTKDSGQVSFFTAHPGITRGEHYHHSKSEKFLVIKGRAKFKFRHIFTDETFELTVDGNNLQMVEAVPGWSHNITNIGSDEMLVLLWANEVFDRNKPDTIPHKV